MASRLGQPNPVLERGFNVARVNMGAFSPTAPATMTVDGTVRKTAFLLAVVAVTGIATAALGDLGMLLALPCIFIGLVLALVLAFKPHLAPKLAVPYAVIEGIVVGAVSRFYGEAFGSGIVLQAVLLSFGILAGLLAAYRSGKIRVTDNFRLGIVAATAGIFLFHMIALVGSFIGFQVPLIWSNGPWGILFSLGVVVVASLNLVLDFDFIERGEAQGLPASMEWYGAFGVLVTMIWLYLEILRLLAKLQSRR